MSEHKEYLNYILISEEKIGRELKNDEHTLQLMDAWKIIESHAEHTYTFVSKIPWPEEYRNIPHIARKHHGKLDGELVELFVTEGEWKIGKRKTEKQEQMMGELQKG